MKPILFNTDMVRALLDGRKTETRRIAKTNNRGLLIKPCEVGDLLWVRETWNFLPCITCMEKACMLRPSVWETPEEITEGCWLYRADGAPFVFHTGQSWRPAIHMPKQAARIFLRVTGVTWQELQEITDREARAEGLGDPDVIYTRGALPCIFADLWDSTIPKDRMARDGWEANPLVCVIRFERCGRPEGWPE